MNNTILEYARQRYQDNFREPEGNLKYRYIVPGGGYTVSLWDWDSWLVDIGLSQFVLADISEYQKGCVLNFLSFINDQGAIPIVVKSTAKPFPNGTVPQTNIHKPCLAQHAAFIIKNNQNDAEWLRPHFPSLKAYVSYYIKHHRHESTGLYFWLDDFAIGVDNDPCTFYRPNRSSASILLNCFFYKELEALCYISKLLGEDMTSFQEERANLKSAVQTLCYDEKDGFYYSVDLNLNPIDPTKQLHSGKPRHWDSLIQRIGCWSGFLAMWCGIATQEQAERMVKENLLDEKAFWAPYGIRSLSKYEKMYTVEYSNNPSCWLGPVWGVSNYLVFRGLLKYGFEKEARELAEKTVALFSNDIEKTGCMHENYDPEDGSPIGVGGFQNWNLLSLNMQAWLNGDACVEEF